MKQEELNKKIKEEENKKVINFSVGLNGDDTFSINSDKDVSMLNLIEALSIIQLSILSQLEDKEDREVTVETMKTFLLSINEAVSQSLVNYGFSIEEVKQIFNK